MLFPIANLHRYSLKSVGGAGGDVGDVGDVGIVGDVGVVGGVRIARCLQLEASICWSRAAQ